jgi:hypothetical protein
LEGITAVLIRANVTTMIKCKNVFRSRFRLGGVLAIIRVVGTFIRFVIAGEVIFGWHTLFAFTSCTSLTPGCLHSAMGE